MIEGGRMEVARAAIPKPKPRLEMRGLEPLKIIADPVRLRLVEALRLAPSTVKELATHLAVAPKSLYYHIGLLERHGMVQVVDSRLVSGILEKTYQATAYLFDFTDLESTGDSADPHGIQAMASSFFTITNDEIMESIRDGLLHRAAPDTPVEQTMQSAWQLLRLKPDQAKELGARLQTLLQEYHQLSSTPGADTQTYRVLYTMFPVQRIEDRDP
jgi:DNA-binding transcriptional ArsR family regulator